MIWRFLNLTRYFDITFCVIVKRECLPLLGLQSLYADLLRLLWYLRHQLLNDRSFWKRIICCFPVIQMFLQGLSKEVFERRRSTGLSELFFLSIWYDATKFVFPSVFSLIETICPNIRSKSRAKIAKCLLPSSTFDKDIGRKEYPL